MYAGAGAGVSEGAGTGAGTGVGVEADLVGGGVAESPRSHFGAGGDRSSSSSSTRGGRGGVAGRHSVEDFLNGVGTSLIGLRGLSRGERGPKSSTKSRGSRMCRARERDEAEGDANEGQGRCLCSSSAGTTSLRAIEVRGELVV